MRQYYKQYYLRCVYRRGKEISHRPRVNNRNIFEGIDYETEIGIWGLNVVGRIVRPGMRVRYRRKEKAKVPSHHYVSRDEAQYFLKKNFGVDIVEKIEHDYA